MLKQRNNINKEGLCKYNLAVATTIKHTYTLRIAYKHLPFAGIA